MLIVKMMVDDPNESMEDGNTRKKFRMLTGVVDIRFDFDDNKQMCAYIWYSDEADPKQKRPDIFACGGNVYIMNEAGRTIGTFCPSDAEGRWNTPPKTT